MPLTLSLEEYEDVREHSECFAVAAGHVYPEAEVVVRQNGRFTVVRKVGVAALVAQAFDQRSRGRDGER
jgi:hypothetical protein